ncbi:pepsin-like aspartic protease [Aspergillus undulatus]|uniref:pepsin-like aspartic protease n=1 Tax=Aspergillus undulatus TaxID=1810928 RepID=UPI003CCD888D
MRLSQCLLSAAYLYAGADAFIPYAFKVRTVPHVSADANVDVDIDVNLDRRFVPVRKLSGDALHDEMEESPAPEDGLLNLAVDVSTHVRRDNIYKVVLADKPTEPNTVALHQDGMDYSYFATVNVGTPGQPVWMMLDTGGANTWLFGANCTAEPCLMHNSFGDNSSSTVERTTDTFEVGYGSGKVSGDLVKDHLTIANINVEMTFGLADIATDDFRDYPIDGILGLGRSGDKSLGGRRAFMDLVMEQEDLKSNIVGFHLSRNSDGERDGVVSFGSVDKTKFKGDIAYTPVAKDSIHWSIPLDDVNVNGKACNLKNKFAIIDTGTSYSLIPPKDAEAIHNLIPGSKSLSDENYLVPCDSTTSVKFTFSGVDYNMSPKDYIGAELESGGGCVSTLIAQAVFGDDVMILGDTFLKNVYSVFDFDNDRIGFAQLPDSSIPGTSTTTGSVASPTDTFATANSNSDSNSNSNSSSGLSSSSSENPSQNGDEFTGAGATFTIPVSGLFLPALAGSLLFLFHI